jgi:hypothetical protein
MDLVVISSFIIPPPCLRVSVFFDFEKTAPIASTSRNSTCEIPNAAEGKIPSMKV